jgi:hypothetical protein
MKTFLPGKKKSLTGREGIFYITQFIYGLKEAPFLLSKARIYLYFAR